MGRITFEDLDNLLVVADEIGDADRICAARSTIRRELTRAELEVREDDALVDEFFAWRNDRYPWL